MTGPVCHRPSDDARRRVQATMPFAVDRRVPGTLHAAVVRAQLPHARLAGIEVEEALAQPGVRGIVTARDLRSHPRVSSLAYGESRLDQPVLADGVVRYVGEPVAILVAETRAQARAAAQLVFLDEEELPYETDHLRAAEPAAPQLHEEYPGNDCGNWRLIHHDADRGLDEADRVYEHTYDTPAASHVPLEPHVATARWSDGALEVWAGTQSPYNVQKRLASIFGLAPDAVRVRGDNLGGGFGSKTDARIEPLVAAAALVIGAPVRLELDREEVFKTLAKHAARVTITTGVRLDGTFTARKVSISYNAGAYANTTPRATRTGMLRSPGPYRIPHVAADVRGIYTNTVPTGPFRGAMTGQVCWAHESTADEIARDLGLDPLEVRRRNVLVEGDTYATGETMHDIRYLDLIDAIERELGPPGRPNSPDAARGVGYALVIKSTRTPSRSEARLRLELDGTVTLLTSSVDMGQGMHHALGNELARLLGVDLAQVQVSCADTAFTPFDTTTSSSRTSFCMGNAVGDAASRLRERLVDHVRSMSGPDVTIAPGRGGVTVGDELLPFASIAAALTEPIEVLGSYDTPPGMGELDPETTQGVASVHWHQGAVGVEVEVDRRTGRVTIVRARGASYAGRVLDELRVQQQSEGGMVFGLGQALFEELHFDAGQLTNPNLSDYQIPSLLDLPADLSAVTLANPESGADVHGVGENTVPPMAPAVANAIHDAVGVRIRSLPITAERVLRALEEVSS